MTAGPFPNQEQRDPTRPWAASPFKRLARVHAASVAGDATFNVALAGLVFLNVSDLNQARWRVAAALVFTVIPFTLAAPFIGPLIDRARGGRKWMIVALSALRALTCLALIRTRDNALLLYPEFLLALVFQKGYIIAKGAVVPTTVSSDEELVTANSKLSALSGIAAIAGGLPALGVMWLVGKVSEGHGADGALVLGTAIYAVATILAVQLPNARVASQPAGEAEEHELRGAGIRHASVAISVIRGTVGFLTFMLAFHFKDIDSKVGLAGSVIGAQTGFMVGAFLAPRIRRQLAEEQILMAALGVTVLAGLLTALMGEVAGATLIAFGVGLTSNSAKQAFDALVQRDAPDANRGRAFARFETRFQLIWVVGALIPTAFALPIGLGFLLIAAACAAVLLWYYQGLRHLTAAARRRPSPLEGEPVLVEPRPPSRSFLRGRREARAAVETADAGAPILGLDTPVEPAGPPDPTLVLPDPAAPGAALAGADPTLVEGAPSVDALPVAPPSATGTAVDGLDEGVVAAEVVPAGVAAPRLYDGSLDDTGERPRPPLPPLPPDAHLDEVPPPPPRWRSGQAGAAAPVGPRRDPGPPSLVRPEPLASSVLAQPEPAPPGPVPSPTAPTAPTAEVPPAPVPPGPPVGAPGDPDEVVGVDGAEGLQLTAADGSMAEPQWRDSATPPLPGFEHLADDGPAAHGAR